MSPCLVAVLSFLSLNEVTEGKLENLCSVGAKDSVPEVAMKSARRLILCGSLLLNACTGNGNCGCFCLRYHGGLLLSQLCLWYQFSEDMIEKQFHKNLTSPQPEHNCFQFFQNFFYPPADILQCNYNQ